MIIKLAACIGIGFIIGVVIMIITSYDPENCESPDIHPCDTCKHDWESWGCDSCDPCTKADSNYEPKTEDGSDYLRGYQDGYYARGVLDRAGVEIHIDKPRGFTLNADSSSAYKQVKDEPQTKQWHYDEKDRTWYPYSHDCGTCKNSLGDWDGHSLACGRCCGADYEFYEPKDEPQTDCDTCRYGQDKRRYAHICNECGVGINNYTPQSERGE